MKAITADHLGKSYIAGRKALSNVSFTLDQGEVFGFLGPNGAGKTTAVKLLNGMLLPSEGTASVMGINPFSSPEQVHMISGVLTEHAQMYGNLTGIQNLVFYGELFGLDAKNSRESGEKLLEMLNLSGAKDQKLETYSTGMRQRLSLARALIHRPQLLFLDEPTSGLDPESAQTVNNLIRTLAREEGTTVFLCTHQLRYAQEICTSYGLIDEGVLLAEGNIEKLRSLVFSGLTVTVKADRFPAEISSRNTDAGSVEIDVQSEREIAGIVKRIVDAGGNVYHVSAKRLSLEDIYFELLKKQTGKGGADD